MESEIVERMELLNLEILSGLVEEDGVTAIKGETLTTHASLLYRECLALNLNPSREVPLDPVKSAIEGVETEVMESIPWNYCKFLNGMTRSEMKQYEGKLLRFRGMVQEVYDPVMYRAEGKVKLHDGQIINECFVFRDVYEDGKILETKEDHKQLRDLELLHCVPTPGENDWFSQVAYDLHTPKVFQEGKKYDDFNSDDQRNTTIAFPLPYMYEDDMRKACIVKVYNVHSGIRTNEVFDFYGILSLFTEDEEFPSHNDDFDKANDEDAERMVREPRPHIVPRLHCVAWVPLFHPRILETIPPVQTAQESVGIIEQILLDAFMGDEIVAKYVLFNLVSNVEYRHSGSTPVGFLPILVSDICSNKIGHIFSQVVASTTPYSYFMENLHAALAKNQFVPTKDFRTNKLKTGLLQLADGTHLIVQDLTRTNEVQSLRKGLSLAATANINALEYLIEWQALKYDYGFNQLEVKSNIPIIVLSRSRISLIVPCLTVVPFRQQLLDIGVHEEMVVPNMIKLLENPDVANGIRTCLHNAKYAQCKPVPDSLTDLITGDFVKSRQNNDMSRHMTEDDFNRCLTMTKCYAKIYSGGEVTYDAWKMILSLESERKQRLAEMPQVD